ncbi:MAG: 4-(cytidine 5'-diphospho)-2-C-methyl-D-erythritol kinase, partial [Chthoniobacteraceae bacterium]
LTLGVKRRREDGFHEIESLACPISLYDTLEIEATGAGGLDFTCDDPTLPTDETNLVVRAARLFCASRGIEPHLRIALTKRIPHGAGLGGGSSDAAATLLALDRIFETKVGVEALGSMAAELGSDVPLFLHRSAARVHGRGELVAPAAFPHALPLLLIKPPFGVPTPWAYRQWKDSREIPGVVYAPQKFSWGVMHNDLERPVFEKYLFLAALKTWLLAQEQVSGALMSGSGSTVFAVLREKDSATLLSTRIADEFGPDLWCCVAETVG